jgi:hypothetical protein
VGDQFGGTRKLAGRSTAALAAHDGSVELSHPWFRAARIRGFEQLGYGWARMPAHVLRVML